MGHSRSPSTSYLAHRSGVGVLQRLGGEQMLAAMASTAPRDRVCTGRWRPALRNPTRLVGSGADACDAGAFPFQPPPIEPCMRFSRTRLTDALHRRCSTGARQARLGLGAATIPLRETSPNVSLDR